MQPSEARLTDTREWLSRADLDLRSARHALAADSLLVEDVLFHCQQAVEKALKAFLTWHDEPFRKTHSLEELGEQCLRLDAALGPVVDQVAPLTEYAWRFRYPGPPERPSLEEAQQALVIAEAACEAVVRRLPLSQA